MISINNLRSFLIEWNNTFVLDKTFRSKNNITFNSPEHRAVCQIDIYLEYLEDFMFEEHAEYRIISIRKEEEYKKGIWLQERSFNNVELNDAYDKIDIDLLNL